MIFIASEKKHMRLSDDNIRANLGPVSHLLATISPTDLRDHL